jgi:hypothetical protein
MNLLAAMAGLEKNRHYKKDPCFVILLNQIIDRIQRQNITDAEITKAVNRIVFDES